MELERKMDYKLFGVISLDTVIYFLYEFLFCLYISISSYVKKGDTSTQLGYEWILLVALVLGYLRYTRYREVLRVMTFCFIFFYLGCYEDLLFTYGYVRLLYFILTIVSIFCLYKYYELMVMNIGENKILLAIFIIFGVIGFWLIPVVNIREKYGHFLALIVLALMIPWTTALFTSFQVLLDKIIKRTSDNNAPKSHRISWKTSSILMLFIGLFWATIYYPGIISPDVAGIYNCAKNFSDVSVRSDIHSFFYILIERAVFLFTDNYFVLVVLLVLAFSAVWAMLCWFLQNNGMDPITILAMTLIWISYPANIWMMISSWKDQPFATCMLLLSVLLSLFAYNNDTAKKKWYCAALILTMFGIATFRSNGQVVLICIAVLLIVLAILKKEVKYPLISAIVAISILLIFKGPFFSIMGVSGTPKGFVSLPFLNAIWESSYKGRELSDKTIMTIENILPIEEFNASYKNDYLNVGVFPNGYLNLDTDSIVDSFKEVAKDYPFDVFISRMKKTYNIWSVFPSSDYMIDTNYEPVIRDFTDIGGESWKYIDFFEPFRRLFRCFYISPNYLNAIWYCFGRSGFCIFMWWEITYYCIRKKEKRILLPILPALFNTIALMIGCCFQDCAYFYPMVAVSIPYFFIFLQYFARKTYGNVIVTDGRKT